MPDSAVAAPLTPDRLRTVMEASKLLYKEDEPGHFMGVLGSNEDVPFDVYYTIFLDGEDRDILWVRLFSAAVVPDAARLRAVFAANKFNNDMRWPKTYISEDEEPRLVGEEQLDSIAGVTDQFMVYFLRNALGHAWTMFKTLHKECFQ